MNATKIALRGDAVSWAPTTDGAIVVLDLRTSRYLSLNAAGSLLWLRLVDGATVADLQAALRDRFGVTESVAEADAEAFLSALRSRDLVDFEQ
jgi:hypothetical protein